MVFCPSTLHKADLMDAALGWLDILELNPSTACTPSPCWPYHTSTLFPSWCPQGPASVVGSLVKSWDIYQVCWKCLATTSSDFFEFVLNRGGKSLPIYPTATNLFFWVLLRNSELAKLHRSSYSVSTSSLLVSLNISSKTSLKPCQLGVPQGLKRSTP